MSQDFELKFDEYKDNDPTENKGVSNPDNYPSSGNIRNLAFVWPDGKIQFFNYSYLITCSYSPENSSVLLEFSTHYIKLKGQRLETLLFDLMGQVNKVIRCYDRRYTNLVKEGQHVVVEIIVIEKR